MTTTFRYRAADSSGQIIEGSLNSSSEKQAIEELRQRNLFPFDIAERAPVQDANREALTDADSLAVWTRAVATMLQAGIPLERALAFNARGSLGRTLSRSVAQVRKDVSEGSALSQALARHPRVFPPVYVAMTKAGEETASMAAVLDQVADDLDESAALKSQIRTALVYPALMAVVATLGVAVILLFVVPRFAAMLDEVGGTLPPSTRLLMWLSRGLVEWWWLVALAVAAIVWLVRWALKDPANVARWHALRLSLPLIGPFETSNATARFSRAFGLLQENGVGVVPALRVARAAVSNLALSAALTRAEARVTQGEKLGRALSEALPTFATELIAVGEETGSVAPLSLRVAASYERDVRDRLRTLIGLIEPVLIISLGAVVAFVALAMLQAIYSVNARIL